MKKLLFMLMGVAATINVMAVDYTAKANLLLGATSGEDCEMYLRQSDSYGTLEDYDMFMDNRQVALYAINGEQKLQMAKAKDLTNLALGLKTDASTTYTITVSGVAGDETLVLFDLLENEEYDLVNNAVINITAAANSTIEDRFVINYVPAPVYDAQVTTNEDGWASFSYAGNLAPVDASAQTLYKGAINGNVLDLYAVDYVKEDQGVLVKGAANTTYYFAAGSGSSDFAGNDLKPASAWESHTGTIFCLKGNALYEYTGSDMPANKAYLEISSSSAPARIILRFNEEQGIEDVKAGVQAEKFVENGQVFIRRGNEVFNLQGQIVK